METFRQKQMKLDELSKTGWEAEGDHFCERDKKYGISELRVLDVIQPQTDDATAAPAATTFSQYMVSLENVPAI